jgi:hypothetical protein
MSGLIVRSWADQEDLQAALRRGIPSLILEAVNSSAFQQKISFMANPDFGARLADAHLVIAPKTHCYGAGWFGPASIMCAGGFSRARGSEVFHATKIICWETACASRGLTVGCFPPFEVCPGTPTGYAWVVDFEIRFGLRGKRLRPPLQRSQGGSVPANRQGPFGRKQREDLVPLLRDGSRVGQDEFRLLDELLTVGPARQWRVRIEVV